jgi:hypothetical protein
MTAVNKLTSSALSSSVNSMGMGMLRDGEGCWLPNNYVAGGGICQRVSNPGLLIAARNLGRETVGWPTTIGSANSPPHE